MGLFKAIIVLAIFLVILAMIENHQEKNVIARTLHPVRHYISIGGVVLFELCI